MPEERTLVLCTVTAVRDVNIVYPCCNQCYTKMLYDFQFKGWWCVKCKYSCQGNSVSWRYRLTLTVADESDICNIAVFGSTVQDIVGCDAKQYSSLTKQYQEMERFEMLLEHSLQEVLLGNCYYFGFKFYLSKGDKLPSSVVLRTVKEYSLFPVCNTQTLQKQSNVGLADIVAFQMIPVQEVKLTLITSIQNNFSKNLLGNAFDCLHNSSEEFRSKKASLQKNKSPSDYSQELIHQNHSLNGLSWGNSMNFSNSIQVSDRSSMYDTEQTSIEFSCGEENTFKVYHHSQGEPEFSINSVNINVKPRGIEEKSLCKNIKNRTEGSYLSYQLSLVNKLTDSFSCSELPGIEKLRKSDTILSDAIHTASEVMNHSSTTSVCDFSSSFETSSLMLACESEFLNQSSNTKNVMVTNGSNNECDDQQSKIKQFSPNHSCDKIRKLIFTSPCVIMSQEKHDFSSIEPYHPTFMKNMAVSQKVEDEFQIEKHKSNFVKSQDFSHEKFCQDHTQGSLTSQEISHNRIKATNQMTVANGGVIMPDSEDLNVFLESDYSADLTDTRPVTSNVSCPKQCENVTDKPMNMKTREQQSISIEQVQTEMPYSEDLFAFLESQSVEHCEDSTDKQMKIRTKEQLAISNEQFQIQMPYSEDLSAFLESQSAENSTYKQMEIRTKKQQAIATEQVQIELPYSEDLFAFLESQPTDSFSEERIDVDVPVTLGEDLKHSDHKNVKKDISSMFTNSSSCEEEPSPCDVQKLEESYSFCASQGLGSLSHGLASLSQGLNSLDVSADLFSETSLEESCQDFNPSILLKNIDPRNVQTVISSIYLSPSNFTKSLKLSNKPSNFNGEKHNYKNYSGLNNACTITSHTPDTYLEKITTSPQIINSKLKLLSSEPAPNQNALKAISVPRLFFSEHPGCVKTLEKFRLNNDPSAKGDEKIENKYSVSKDCKGVIEYENDNGIFASNSSLSIEEIRKSLSENKSDVHCQDCDVFGFRETLNSVHNSTCNSLLVCAESPSSSVLLTSTNVLNPKHRRKSVHFARKMSVIKSIPLIDIQMKFASSPLDEHSEYKHRRKSCLKTSSASNNSLQMDDDIFSQDLFSPISSAPNEMTYNPENVDNSFVSSPEILSQDIVVISNIENRDSPISQFDHTLNSAKRKINMMSVKHLSKSSSKEVGSYLSVTHSLFSDCSFSSFDEEGDKTSLCLSGGSCLSCSLFSSSGCDSSSTSSIHKKLFQDR